MRALRVAVVVMGVMIVLAVAGLVAGVVFKLRARPTAPASVAVVPTGGTAVAAVLDEPTGTRITGVAAAAGRLAVTLQGGGPDRVVLLDPTSGAVVGRVGLAR